jgi:uncharacterized membrane protein
MQTDQATYDTEVSPFRPSAGRQPGSQKRMADGNQRMTQRATTRGYEERLAQGLGWFSIGLGMAELLAPEKLGKLIGVKDHHGLMRTMGLREIAAGAGILTQQRPAGWMWARVGGDMLDLALLGASLGNDNARRSRVATAAAAVAGVTALDVLCSRLLSEQTSSVVRVIETITVNRPPEECYRYWHDFENLPRFMDHLQSVRTTGEGRSHWVAKAPAGMKVEWDAEITEDVPNQRIAWRSLAGADVDNSGSVRFERAPAGRGTVIKADIEYRPPAGKIGSLAAKLFGEEPGQQARADLRRFKQMLETGEITTTEGQSSGRAKS